MTWIIGLIVIGSLILYALNTPRIRFVREVGPHAEWAIKLAHVNENIVLDDGLRKEGVEYTTYTFNLQERQKDFLMIIAPDIPIKDRYHIHIEVDYLEEFKKRTRFLIETDKKVQSK